MMPEEREMTFEKVNTSDFVTGVIEDIERDKEHKKIYQGKESIKDCIRFVFNIEGCKFPHRSNWMTFNYSAKGNLFGKYLTSLVDGAKEYMKFDVEQLKGMKVKMLWKDVGDFQAVETIRPVEKKIIPLNSTELKSWNDLQAQASKPEEIPF